MTDADTPPVMEKRPTDNGLWVAGANAWVDKSDVNAKFHGQVIDSVLGYDHKLNADTVVGVAMGCEHYDFLTSYNNGTVKGQSLSISPYFGYAFTDWLSFDATAGHGWVSYDYTRTNDSITGSNTASRWFGSTDIAATQHYGDTVLRASFGYLKVYEDQKLFTESDGTVNDASQVNLGELRSTISGVYDIREDWGVFSPTGFVRFEYDLNAPHSVDVAVNGTTSAARMGATIGLGANAQLNNGWKLGMTGSSEEFRRNTGICTLLGNARYDF